MFNFNTVTSLSSILMRKHLFPLQYICKRTILKLYPVPPFLLNHAQSSKQQLQQSEKTVVVFFTSSNVDSTTAHF